MTSARMMLLLASYLVVVNVVAYGAMSLDKAKARAGYRRIPENNLLFLAVIGGSVGTVLAQQIERHKTRKEPFRTILIAVICAQIAFLVAAMLVGPEGLHAALLK